MKYNSLFSLVFATSVILSKADSSSTKYETSSNVLNDPIKRNESIDSSGRKHGANFFFHDQFLQDLADVLYNHRYVEYAIQLFKLYWHQALLAFILIVMTICSKEMSDAEERRERARRGKGVPQDDDIDLDSSLEEMVESYSNTPDSIQDIITEGITSTSEQIKQVLSSVCHMESSHSETEEDVLLQNFNRSSLGGLPDDAQINILSYLSPRDITKYGCVCKSTSELVAYNPYLWKTILLRDYDFILHRWDISRTSFLRSCPELKDMSLHLSSLITKSLIDTNSTETRYSGKKTSLMRDIYFRFRLTWINWALAGNNTNKCCLVGIYNSIFDITKFLEFHPGSHETLLIHSGCDATDFFEDVGHSRSAREVGVDMCVVHMGYDDDTEHEFIHGRNVNDNDGSINHSNTSKTSEARRLLPMIRSKIKRKKKREQTLSSVRRDLERELHEEKRKARRWKNSQMKLTKHGTNPEILGHVNVYYDALVTQSWKWWYLNWKLDPVFVNPANITTHGSKKE